MRILIVLGHNRLTGVNTWALTLAKEFVKHGHDAVIEISTSEYDKFDLDEDYRGYYDMLAQENIPCYVNVLGDDYSQYDAILLSYNVHAPKFEKYEGKRIFVLHGMPTNFDGLYLPPAGYFTIAVSQFLMEWWNTDALVNHGVDIEFFKPANSPASNDPPKKALCITRYNNDFMQLALKAAGISCEVASDTSPAMLIKKMYDADFVVAAGRSCYEAMACGKRVFVAGHCGIDGWMTPWTFHIFLYKNCSGYLNHLWSESFEKIVQRLKYSNLAPKGMINRQLITANLTAESMYLKYLTVIESMHNGRY